MLRRFLLLFWFVAAALFAGVGPVSAQPASRPASPTDTIQLPSSAASERPDGEAGSPGSSRSVGLDLSRMAVALAIVLGMIFAARWAFGRMFAGSRAPAASRAVRVLGRTSIAPRQQVLLLQVGRRVVVVGESNGQLSTLAQLEDADEVAELLGQLQQEQSNRAGSFGGLFGRAEKSFEEASTSEAAPSAGGAEEAQVRSELSGLMEKVRSIRNQIGRE